MATLNLTTSQTRRSIITIDDVPYEMKSLDEFSLISSQRCALFGKKLVAFYQEAGIDAEVAAQLSADLNSILHDILVNVPEDVLGKLSDTQKVKVVNAFLSEQDPNRSPT